MEKKYEKLLKKYASDILYSKGMRMEKGFVQHGSTSTYAHSVSVAITCIKIADKLNLDVDMRSLVRGALLHDYYLYDWHEKRNERKWHGFTHAEEALKNASKEFKLNNIEKNMIYCHMFPLNLRIPKYKETTILCIADKICASNEVYEENKYKLLKIRYNFD